MERSRRDDPHHILKRSQRSEKWPAEFAVRAVVESADAADASRGLIAGAHAIHGIELLSWGGAGCSLIGVSGRLRECFFKALAACGGGHRDHSGGQNRQRGATPQEMAGARVPR